ncbi:MAG: protein-L-isoaspartate O-methyltransferase, partial [Alphaproteobacteria bacterium]|nr:protein-L-isoaspartate O-methyltransferase [Alphaproteobacteria bacterium]
MTNFADRRRMMVDNQVRPSDVTKYPIIEALLSVERENFVPQALREAAYLGENLAFSKDRVLLEPRTLAKMLDALDITADELVLDLGAGMGYSSAVIAQMAQAVIAVEEDETLARDAETLLAETGVVNAVVETGPIAAGAPQHGPYDVITVEGAVEVVPQAIIDQLK